MLKITVRRKVTEEQFECDLTLSLCLNHWALHALKKVRWFVIKLFHLIKHLKSCLSLPKKAQKASNHWDNKDQWVHIHCHGAGEVWWKGSGLRGQLSALKGRSITVLLCVTALSFCILSLQRSPALAAISVGLWREVGQGHKRAPKGNRSPCETRACEIKQRCVIQFAWDSPPSCRASVLQTAPEQVGMYLTSVLSVFWVGVGFSYAVVAFCMPLGLRGRLWFTEHESFLAPASAPSFSPGKQTL